MHSLANLPRRTFCFCQWYSGIAKSQFDAFQEIQKMLGTGLHFAFEQNDSVLRLYFTDETGSGRAERKAKVKEVKNVRLWIDTSSVEIFVNDGAVVFSTRFYPDSDKIELYVRADHPCAITGWNLKPITMERGQIYV